MSLFIGSGYSSGKILEILFFSPPTREESSYKMNPLIWFFYDPDHGVVNYFAFYVQKAETSPKPCPAWIFDEANGGSGSEG
jgi:hypothetical protein